MYKAGHRNNYGKTNHLPKKKKKTAYKESGIFFPFNSCSSISALLTMPKPLTVGITINYGKF